MTHETACLGIVLAAGEGTRMKSATPKVLHPVGGRPMLDAVLASARAGGIKRLAVVIGAGADLLRSHLARSAADVAVHEQTARLGTAHAVLAAAAAIRPDEDVIVLYGDTPLVEGATIARLRARLAEGVDIAVLGFRARDPFGYGRLILADGRLTAIVEERDADAATRAVDLCNSGIMAFRAGLLPDLLEAVGNANAKGEYYLTDTVAIGVGRGLVAAVVEGDEDEFTGVNDRVQLAAAEAGFQRRARRAAMLGGATLVAPETVFFSHDTRLGHDVTIAPNVVFGPGVSIANDVTIHAFSHIEAAHVDSGAIIGPYARLRPGAAIGPDAHIGNFVEIKNADIAAGAKVNHLTYIGDASVGARTNIGAGTITCNYDGVSKHRTDIGAAAFIGSHTTLVAPVKVGDGAFTAAGSVITRDVPADAMAFGRSRQDNKDGMARAKREALLALKMTNR
jgi:bifunctional UDP-N-acetylglucosamine pyrophosphorylase/glucosamine-1-phosphate N-acetyltransferase